MRKSLVVVAALAAVVATALLACEVLATVLFPCWPSGTADAPVTASRDLDGSPSAEQALAGIHWLQHSGFRVEKAGKVIYIDPVSLKTVTPATLVLVTHPHADHCSPKDIGRIAGPGTVVVCPQACADELSALHPVVVKCGDHLEIDGVAVDVVPAYSRWYRPLHLRLFRYVGYVVSVGGVRIYHAGDTDSIREMGRLGAVSVALLPVGGKLFTMDPKEAAAALAAIQPTVAIPMHYGPGLNPRNGQEFATLAAAQGSKIVIASGE